MVAHFEQDASYLLRLKLTTCNNNNNNNNNNYNNNNNNNKNAWLSPACSPPGANEPTKLNLLDQSSRKFCHTFRGSSTMLRCFSLQQCRASFSWNFVLSTESFNLFRFCRKDDISFDTVAKNGNIAEAAINFLDRIVRHVAFDIVASTLLLV